MRHLGPQNFRDVSGPSLYPLPFAEGTLGCQEVRRDGLLAGAKRALLGLGVLASPTGTTRAGWRSVRASSVSRAIRPVLPNSES